MEIKNSILPQHNKLFTTEILTIAYSMLTSLMVIVLWRRLDNPLSFFPLRILSIGIILLLYYGTSLPGVRQIVLFLRVMFPLALLSQWYGETYLFNRIFTNLDPLFASWEQNLFGFQPALAFSEIFSSKWVSEAFYMGYFIYFPMMVTVLLYCFYWRRDKFNQLGFIFLGSFFLYYLIFVFLPVTGPQFYFKAIGLENAAHGIFPPVGDYFRYHTDLLPGPGYDKGLFYKLVKISQALGERPTAAFPSSHVGISTILMIWLYGNNKKLLFILLPFYLLLCGATVYIRAHYLIDVLAGWISAFVFYYAFHFAYRKSNFPNYYLEKV